MNANLQIIIIQNPNVFGLNKMVNETKKKTNKELNVFIFVSKIYFQFRLIIIVVFVIVVVVVLIWFVII